MSQAKVDKYKQNKQNRKKIMRKQKIENLLLKAAGVVVALAIIGWAGYSGYSKWETSRPVVSTEINTTALSDYLSGLSQ